MSRVILSHVVEPTTTGHPNMTLLFPMQPRTVPTTLHSLRIFVFASSAVLADAEQLKAHLKMLAVKDLKQGAPLNQVLAIR
jgi:hypothetical protein